VKKPKTEKPLPCPWEYCGREVVVQTEGADWWFIQCDGTGDHWIGCGDQKKADVIAMWNKHARRVRKEKP
jgi:hypothetical protein